jgi:integrase
MRFQRSDGSSLCKSAAARHLKRFGAHIKPQLTAADVKPLHVQRWIDKQYRGKSPTYRNIAITAVKAAFNWAVEQGYLGHNPVARMKKPRCACREFFVPAVDWLRVLNAARGQQFKELITVMFATGARPQEMRMIAARHYEPDLTRIVLLREESKGKKRRRVIYLDEVSRDIVERLVRTFSRGPLFRNSRGRPWTSDALSARFRRLRAKLGMPQLCAYTLRHSYAHWQLTAGTDSHIVSKLLGHSDGRMLETRYGHIDRDVAFMMDTAQKAKSPFVHHK